MLNIRNVKYEELTEAESEKALLLPPSHDSSTSEPEITNIPHQNDEVIVHGSKWVEDEFRRAIYLPIFTREWTMT